MNQAKRVALWNHARIDYERAVSDLVAVTKALRQAESTLFYYPTGNVTELPMFSRDWLNLPLYLVLRWQPKQQAPAGPDHPPQLYDFAQGDFGNVFQTGCLAYNRAQCGPIVRSNDGAAEVHQVLLVETPPTSNGRR